MIKPIKQIYVVLGPGA